MITQKELPAKVGIEEIHSPLQRSTSVGNFFYMTYPEKLKDPRWQKKRLQIFERDNWTCQKCNDKDSTLHVHHLKYHKNPWDVSDDFLVTLCHECHSMIEVFNDEIPFENIFVLRIKNASGCSLVITNCINGGKSIFATNKEQVLINFDLSKDNIESITKTLNG